MIERYFIVLEDFMINEKLCVMLNFTEDEIDIPTFLDDIYREFDIIKQEFNANDKKFIILLDLTIIPYNEPVLQQICKVINNTNDHLLKNIDKFIVYKKNYDSPKILQFIEKFVERTLFDKIVVDNNITQIINSALTNTELLTTISHPVKTDNN